MRENPSTSLRQQTHLSKLFIARLTLQSSQRLRQRHGQTITLRDALWQTTQSGPAVPRPSDPVAHERSLSAVGLLRRDRMISSSSSASSLVDRGVFPGRPWKILARSRYVAVRKRE